MAEVPTEEESSGSRLISRGWVQVAVLVLLFGFFVTGSSPSGCTRAPLRSPTGW